MMISDMVIYVTLNEFKKWNVCFYFSSVMYLLFLTPPHTDFCHVWTHLHIRSSQ